MLMRALLALCLVACVLSDPWPQSADDGDDCDACVPSSCVDVSRYCPDHLILDSCGCCKVCSKIVGDLGDPHHAHCLEDKDDHDVHDHNHETHDEFCEALGHQG
ncbi:insulin-like growth factor-binding protein 7 [Procambarus clarkii]|uniref:insulin-like growth factor-binding protein 7 n=1 Tax=Procambarus clarkii TaxID=6728 RepID=UPI001E67572E|nr:insulin-like growth factor-binding protein 7 [Procambarus clarkii]